MSSNIINNSNSSCQSTKGVLMVEKKPTTRPQEQLNCPRCNSTNTKFCYYNNYSLTQPRYFCKTCRRYWTEGGSLRNVPVGGGSRKNKRLPTTATTSSLSTSLVAAATAPSSSVSSFRLPDLNPPSLISQFNSTSSPHVVDGSCGKELNLGFPLMQDSNQAMELLRSTGVASRGLLSSFMPTLMPADSNAVLFSSGLGDHPDQEFKPNNLSFSIDHGIEDQSDGAKIFFPFGELKHEFPRTATTDHDHQQSKKSQDHETTTNTPPSGSCWSGMLDHGGSW